MSVSATVYPLKALRATALFAQGLTAAQASDQPVGLHQLRQLAERLLCIQIDTLQMVHRTQYLVPWSRLGNYDPRDFDRLAYDAQERSLFEYWGHAAAYIPLQYFRYYLPDMHRRRDHPGAYTRAWLSNPETQQVIERVLHQVQHNGAVRAADFEHPDWRGGTWWNWKPAKRALEHLYDGGVLMISGRHNFQRIYDLQARVLPDWVDTSLPDEAERKRFFLEASVRALGVCQPGQAADYTYMKRTEAKPYLEDLVKSGKLVEVRGEFVDDKTQSLLTIPDYLAVLERSADGDLQPQRTTFLSPFDSLFWARQRDRQLWSFEQTLEAYKPKEQRRWGYYSLAILHNDRLVGRFDPKLERKQKRLHLRALHLEPEIAPNEVLARDFAAALRSFMQFHQAQDLVIETSTPETFKRTVEAAL